MTQALARQVDMLATPFPRMSEQDIAENPAAAADLIRHAAALHSYARALKAEKVRALGDGEAFVRMDVTGRQVRAAKMSVPLSKADGHFYEVQGKAKLSAEAYTRLNTFAGVSVLTPKTMIVEGREVENPYIQTADSDNSVIQIVFVRRVAIGRTATGTLVAVDQTLRFDPRGYLIESLKKVQKKSNGAIRDTTKKRFDAKLADDEEHEWFFLPYLVVGSQTLGLAIQVDHPEIAYKLGDYQNLVKFAERRASSICTRNALRHHPAIGVSTVSPDRAGNVLVPVWAWVEDSNMLAESRAAAKALIGGGQIPEELAVNQYREDSAPEDDEFKDDPIADAIDAEEVTDAEEPGPMTAEEVEAIRKAEAAETVKNGDLPI
jgi:hypothetical protein